MSDYVLNGASVAEAYADRATAQSDLAMMLRGLALLDADAPVLPTFRLPADPWLIPVVREGGDELTLGDLAHSLYATPDRDVAAYFDALSRSMPADAGLDDATIEAVLRLAPDAPAPDHEVCYGSVQAAGFDAMLCAAANFVMASLRRSELWRFDRLGFVANGEIYLFDHVAEPSHAEAIRERRRVAVRASLDARHFWSMKDQAFPNLRFGSDVRNQMERFDAKLLPLLFRRLAELDARARLWREGMNDAFPKGACEIKPETDQTMKRYGADRRFRGYDGVIRTFEHHVWVDHGHRVHLFHHVAERILEIGYVGPHLPTMRHPT